MIVFFLSSVATASASTCEVKVGDTNCQADAQVQQVSLLQKDLQLNKRANIEGSVQVQTDDAVDNAARHDVASVSMLNETKAHNDPCVDGWVKRSSTCLHAAQGNEGRTSQGGLELADCKSQCDDNGNCKGFSYRTDGKVCFWFITRKCDAGQAVPGDAACATAWCNYDKCEAAPSPPPPPPDFTYGSYGSNYCPSGYRNILTIAGCQAAARALGQSYAHTDDYMDSRMDSRPKGCYSYHGAVFLNPNQGWPSNPWHCGGCVPICKKTAWGQPEQQRR